MKVRFTAEIIDDDGNVIGNRVSKAGGIPCPDDFDLSTKEGFFRDFDKLENAVLKKSHIENVFSFHPYIVILDCFHLKKKCQ